MTSDISRAVVGVCFCVSVSGCDRGQLQVLSLKSHLGLKTRSVTGTQFTHGFSCLPGKLVPRCTLLSPAALLTAEGGRGGAGDTGVMELLETHSLKASWGTITSVLVTGKVVVKSPEKMICHREKETGTVTSTGRSRDTNNTTLFALDQERRD